jgi:hypothetical protein
MAVAVMSADPGRLAKSRVHRPARREISGRADDVAALNAAKPANRFREKITLSSNCRTTHC